MVKSTVRFPESMVTEIEALVEEGHFESKSEFYRFATDYMLEQVADGYTPETIDFEEIKAEIFPTPADEPAEGDADQLPFFESAALVRKYVLRGNVTDAEDFIDHHYTAADPQALMLEELLRLYRTDRGPTARRAVPDPTHAPQEPSRPSADQSRQPSDSTPDVPDRQRR